MALRVLNKALNDAEAEDIITANPIRKVRSGSVPCPCLRWAGVGVLFLEPGEPQLDELLANLLLGKSLQGVAAEVRLNPVLDQLPVTSPRRLLGSKGLKPGVEVLGNGLLGTGPARRATRRPRPDRGGGWRCGW
jgi:hypothetical protein